MSAEPHRDPPDARRPILITGAHRSGSTWVGKMIALSPEVGYIREPFHLEQRPGVCAAPFRYWCQHITRENEGAFRQPLARTIRFQYDYAAELRALRTPRDVARMVRDAAHFARHRRNGARALVKDPTAFYAAEWMADRFDMDVVMLIRHPAAFVSSLVRVGWTFNFNQFLIQPLLVRDHLEPFLDDIRRFAREPHPILEQGILLWRIIYAIADTFRDRHPDWIFARHEDLSLRPVEEFRALFEALRISFTPEIEEQIRSFTSPENPREASKGVIHELKRDSRANVYSWKKRLTEAQVAQIREGVGELAHRFYGEEDW